MTGEAGVAAAAPDRNVGVEARKTYAAKLEDGFIEKYLSGMAILDVGIKGMKMTSYLLSLKRSVSM